MFNKKSCTVPFGGQLITHKTTHPSCTVQSGALLSLSDLAILILHFVLNKFKQKAWLHHYEKLLNVEFDWDPDHLSDEPPVHAVECPSTPITISTVKKVISQMKSGKAAGHSGMVVEMVKVAGDTVASMILDLIDAIIRIIL